MSYFLKHMHLTWTEYVNNICDKAWTRIDCLRALKFRISRKSLEKIHISHIRQLLQYSDIVGDLLFSRVKNLKKTPQKQLEAIHAEAAKMVAGAKLSQLIRFARVCSNVDDFNNSNLFLTAKLLKHVIDIIKFKKHFLNSTTDTLS